jgi:hypothetical protein
MPAAMPLMHAYSRGRMSLLHIRLHHDAPPPLLLPLIVDRPCLSRMPARERVAAASRPITNLAFERLHGAPTPGESFIGLHGVKLRWRRIQPASLDDTR